MMNRCSRSGAKINDLLWKIHIKGLFLALLPRGLSSVSETNQCWLRTSSSFTGVKRTGGERGDVGLNAVFSRLNQSFATAVKRSPGSANCILWATAGWLLFWEVSFNWNTAMPLCIHVVLAAFALQWQCSVVETLKPPKLKILSDLLQKKIPISSLEGF